MYPPDTIPDLMEKYQREYQYHVELQAYVAKYPQVDLKGAPETNKQRLADLKRRMTVVANSRASVQADDKTDAEKNSMASKNKKAKPAKDDEGKEGN